MRKWFRGLKWYWKLFAVLLLVATYCNIGYWTHAWAVSATDPAAFGHNFWYGYWPVDVTAGHAMELAVYELLWPMILVFTAAIWLGASAAILFWKLAFQGELFRLITAFFGWDKLLPFVLLVAMFALVSWGSWQIYRIERNK